MKENYSNITARIIYCVTLFKSWTSMFHITYEHLSTENRKYLGTNFLLFHTFHLKLKKCRTKKNDHKHYNNSLKIQLAKSIQSMIIRIARLKRRPNCIYTVL